MTDKSKGLRTDFSGDAVRDHVLSQTAGLTPHERPGHHTPDPPSDRDLSAKAGIEAVRRYDLDDGISHT